MNDTFFQPDKFPSVTVAIPTWNEANYIEKTIRCFLSTKYPCLVEIIIADGGSTDGTREIIQCLSNEDLRIKLLHNPLKLQAVGLNLILKESAGDIFLRADAHSDYAPDYIEQCVEALLSSRALNVGGAQRFVAQTLFQAGVALAARSQLGNGSAKYRNPDYNGYAETVYLGCFWRKALLELSGYDIGATSNEDSELNLRLYKLRLRPTFDTTQVTNQDSKLNLRLPEKQDQAIYVSSKIRAWYYPRKTWKALFIQYFKYGRGRYLTSTKHPSLKQLRGLLPFITLSILVLLVLLSFIFPFLGLPTAVLISLGFLSIAVESLRVTLQFRKDFTSEIWRGNKDNIPPFLQRCLHCAIVLITMPIAHACGYSYQTFRQRILRIKGW